MPSANVAVEAAAVCSVGARMDVVYHLDQVDGHGFEAVMVDIFRRLGYSVERERLSNDEGRDLVVRKAAPSLSLSVSTSRPRLGDPSFRSSYERLPFRMQPGRFCDDRLVF